MREGPRHLALEKYTEDWYYRNPNDAPFDFSKRTICEDVSKLSDEQLEKLLDGDPSASFLLAHARVFEGTIRERYPFPAVFSGAFRACGFPLSS